MPAVCRFLKQDLIKVDGVDGRYVVQEALVDAVARPIFAKADADSNGSVSTPAGSNATSSDSGHPILGRTSLQHTSMCVPAPAPPKNCDRRNQF
jgi:hypothetical protein